MLIRENFIGLQSVWSNVWVRLDLRVGWWGRSVVTRRLRSARVVQSRLLTADD